MPYVINGCQDRFEVLDVYGHLFECLDRGVADALKPPWDVPDVDAETFPEPGPQRIMNRLPFT